MEAFGIPTRVSNRFTSFSNGVAIFFRSLDKRSANFTKACLLSSVLFSKASLCSTLFSAWEREVLSACWISNNSFVVFTPCFLYSLYPSASRWLIKSDLLSSTWHWFFIFCNSSAISPNSIWTDCNLSDKEVSAGSRLVYDCSNWVLCFNWGNSGVSESRSRKQMRSMVCWILPALFKTVNSWSMFSSSRGFRARAVSSSSKYCW